MMIWDSVRSAFEDYFTSQEFSFEIVEAEDPKETECSAVLRIGQGPREQKMTLYLEEEDGISYFRVLSPVVMADKCTREQLLRLMEQNIYWVQTRVGYFAKQVVFTTLLSTREFEADSASLGEAMTGLARRADQMETLLFGRDH